MKNGNISDRKRVFEQISHFEKGTQPNKQTFVYDMSAFEMMLMEYSVGRILKATGNMET